MTKERLKNVLEMILVHLQERKNKKRNKKKKERHEKKIPHISNSLVFR